jgi:hypothetical protein
MIKKTVQKKNSNTSLKQSTTKNLSIQFNLDGFSFCISDSTTKTAIYFSEYLFPETQKKPEELLTKIEEVFRSDKLLQYDFISVTVIHQNSLSILVPNTYFNEDYLASYLSHNIKTLATDYITFDSLEKLDCKNIYIPYVNINNYLFQNFGEFEYKHHSSILIEKLISKSTNNKKTMYVNVSKTALDIVVLENKKLLFYNSFLYTTKEDFIYYILFIAEQLKLDPDKFPLYFIGSIEKETETYKFTYQYIRNVFFLESKNPIFNHLNCSNHSNFILLGL